MSEWFELHAAPVAEARELEGEAVMKLSALVTHLIPATACRPSGAEVLFDRGRLADALAVRPDLWAPLLTVLQNLESAGAGSVATTAAQLFAAIPSEMDDFGKLIAGAYLMDPGVKQDIGYPGQEARDIADDIEDCLDMLEAVVNRGEFYRETPIQK